MNTDTDGVVLRTPDEADTQEIESFLGTLDTLVPGEHLLELEGGTIRVLVDGLAEE